MEEDIESHRVFSHRLMAPFVYAVELRRSKVAFIEMTKAYIKDPDEGYSEYIREKAIMWNYVTSNSNTEYIGIISELHQVLQFFCTAGNQFLQGLSPGQRMTLERDDYCYVTKFVTTGKDRDSSSGIINVVCWCYFFLY